jgi:hypothetical protein
MDEAEAMLPTTQKPNSGYSAAFEGTNLTEGEVEELMEYFARQVAEDQIRDYFIWRLRGPLNRIGWKLKSIHDCAYRAARHDR